MNKNYNPFTKAVICISSLSLFFHINLNSKEIAIAQNEKVSEAIFANINQNGIFPVADQEFIIIPCAPINGNCLEIETYLKNLAKNIENLNDNQIKNFHDQVISSLKNLNGSQSIRSSLLGIVKYSCPTQNCLIYGGWLQENNNLIWVIKQQQGTILEYAPSSGIRIKSTNVPEDILILFDTLKKINVRIRSGLNYTSLPSITSPLYENLSNISSENRSRYSNLITSSNQIANMIKVMTFTWEVYIQSSDGYGMTETHIISCDLAKEIRNAWNNAIGYEDITEIKGGIFGCLGQNLHFATASGKKPWHEAMLEKILKFTNNTIKSHNPINSVGKIPNISLPKKIQDNNNNQKVLPLPLLEKDLPPLPPLEQ